MSKRFLQLGARLNPMVSLVIVKRRGTNFAAIRLMFNSSARMHWHDPCDSPAWLQTSWI